MASQSASYSSMKGKMAAEPVSCGIPKGRTEAESAPCSKTQQNGRKTNGFSCQRRSGEGLERFCLGEARRKARSPHASLRGSRYGFRLLQDLSFGFCVPTRLSPARGWPYSIALRIPPGQADLCNGAMVSRCNQEHVIK